MELDLGIIIQLPHIVLLLLVTTEYAYFFYIRIQKAVKHSIPEGTGTAGDNDSLIIKHGSSFCTTS
jgi:hypothetical protein